MKKGQGSLEYLLILAAILAIAVVVVVVANSLLGSPKAQADISSDKYGCITNHIELIGYNAVGPENIKGLKYLDITCGEGSVADGDINATCTLSDTASTKVNVSFTGSACTYEDGVV
jgi:hypothetical protein